MQTAIFILGTASSERDFVRVFTICGSTREYAIGLPIAMARGRTRFRCWSKHPFFNA
jgi:hypothetical protein